MGLLEISLGRRRAADRRDRHLVALRLLDDRDDRPDRPHRRAPDDAARPARPSSPARWSAGSLTFGSLAAARRRCCTAPAARPPTASPPRSRSVAAVLEAARHPDRPPDPPPAPRALAPRDADAGRRGPLRRPARARLHDLRALLRRLGAGGDQPRGRRSRRWASLIGVGFGVGRAIPIVALAPLAGQPRGDRATELMASTRASTAACGAGDAAALAVAALALVVVPAERRGAPTRRSPDAADPSADDCDARLRADRTASGSCGAAAWTFALPRQRPGDRRALHRRDRSDGEHRQLLDRGSLGLGRQVAAPGADALAVSGNWLVYRARCRRGATDLRPQHRRPRRAGPDAADRLDGGAGQLSRAERSTAPRSSTALASPSGSRIVQHALGTGKGKVARPLAAACCSSTPPSEGNAFVYVAHRRPPRAG